MPKRTIPRTPPPRLGLNLEEAAAAVSLSLGAFEEHVLPDLRVVRLGRRRIVPVKELERWLADHAARALEGNP